MWVWCYVSTTHLIPGVLGTPGICTPVMLELRLTVVETSDKQCLHTRIHTFPKPWKLLTFLIQLVVFQRSFNKSEESKEVGMVKVFLHRQWGNTGSSLRKMESIGDYAPALIYLSLFEHFFLFSREISLGILSQSWIWTIIQHFLPVAYLVHRNIWEIEWFDFMKFIRSYFLWLNLRSNKDLKNRILADDLSLRFYDGLAEVQNMVPS